MPANSESSTVAKRAGIVAAGTLLSRILGAVRESFTAAHFPIDQTDAFFVAFTIPNALRSILGEGAVASAFVPVFSEVRDKEGDDRARRFYQNLSGIFIAILLAVTVLGVLAAPWVVTLYAAGLRDEPARFATTVELTRLVFPYIFFMGLAALGMGVLNASKKFFAPAFAPALLNVAMIAAAVFFIPLAMSFGFSPIAALAFGALVGGVLQVLAQWPSLKTAGFLGRPRFDLSDPYVRKVFKLLGPLVLGLGIYQINLVLARQLASFLPTGAQSYIYYASRVVDLPQGVFALAIGTAALPSLATLKQRDAHDEIKTLFRDALGLSLFVALPATLVLITIAEPTVVMLFMRGQFTLNEVSPTALQLALQAFGIWTVAIIRIVVPVFYAYNDTKSPIVGSAMNLVTFAIVSLGLMDRFGHLALALGLSLATLAQLVVLAFLLRKRIGAFGITQVLASASKIIVLSVVAALVAYGVAQLGHWANGGNDLRNLAVYVLSLTSAISVYFVGARILRCRELDTVLAALRRKRAASAS